MTTILLLFGGESPEHDVSIMSARNVYTAIDTNNYEVKICFIDRRGRWWRLDEWQDTPTDHCDNELYPLLGQKAFVDTQGDELRPDVIVPILHGAHGEDGTVQGLAELLHIPIVGCDMTASAICMNKIATKEILAQNGIAVAPYIVHRSGEPLPSKDEVDELTLPLFVKPSRTGSSVGVSKVTEISQLEEALNKAHRHGGDVLIEQGICGRELEVAVLGNPPDHQTSGVGEIKPGEDFYSYEDKYSETSRAEVIPRAEISEMLSNEIRSTASKVYQVLGCRGLARVDFLTDERDNVYVNEINTLPGFTNISQYPKLWKERGIEYGDLIEKLIQLALEK